MGKAQLLKNNWAFWVLKKRQNTGKSRLLKFAKKSQNLQIHIIIYRYIDDYSSYLDLA